MKNIVEPIKNKKQIESVESYLKEKSIRNRLIFVWALIPD